MPRKKKDALQPESVKTSALVKEPTKAKGKTKEKAAAEEKPHYDIPHGVTIQDICNTYRINMESIAAATNYPIAYIKTLADDPTSSMVPGFQSKLRSAFLSRSMMWIMTTRLAICCLAAENQPKRYSMI